MLKAADEKKAQEFDAVLALVERHARQFFQGWITVDVMTQNHSSKALLALFKEVSKLSGKGTDDVQKLIKDAEAKQDPANFKKLIYEFLKGKKSLGDITAMLTAFDARGEFAEQEKTYFEKGHSLHHIKHDKCKYKMEHELKILNEANVELPKAALQASLAAQVFWFSNFRALNSVPVSLFVERLAIFGFALGNSGLSAETLAKNAAEASKPNGFVIDAERDGAFVCAQVDLACGDAKGNLGKADCPFLPAPAAAPAPAAGDDDDEEDVPTLKTGGAGADISQMKVTGYEEPWNVNNAISGVLVNYGGKTFSLAEVDEEGEVGSKFSTGSNSVCQTLGSSGFSNYFSKNEAEGVSGPQMAFIQTEGGLHAVDCSVSGHHAKVKIAPLDTYFPLQVGQIVDFASTCKFEVTEAGASLKLKKLSKHKETPDELTFADGDSFGRGKHAKVRAEGADYLSRDHCVFGKQNGAWCVWETGKASAGTFLYLQTNDEFAKNKSSGLIKLTNGARISINEDEYQVSI